MLATARPELVMCRNCRREFVPRLHGPVPKWCGHKCQMQAWRRLKRLRRICRPEVSLEEGVANLCGRLREGQGAEFPAPAENPAPAAEAVATGSV
jgi:hypothetical protein